MIKAEKVIHSPQGIIGGSTARRIQFFSFFLFGHFAFVFFVLFCFRFCYHILLIGWILYCFSSSPRITASRCVAINLFLRSQITAIQVVGLLTCPLFKSRFQVVEISRCRDVQVKMSTWRYMLNCRAVDLLKKNADTAGSN